MASEVEDPELELGRPLAPMALPRPLSFQISGLVYRPVAGWAPIHAFLAVFSMFTNYQTRADAGCFQGEDYVLT